MIKKLFFAFIFAISFNVSAASVEQEKERLLMDMAQSIEENTRYYFYYGPFSKKCYSRLNAEFVVYKSGEIHVVMVDSNTGDETTDVQIIETIRSGIKPYREKIQILFGEVTFTVPMSFYNYDTEIPIANQPMCTTTEAESNYESI
jgi:hypothetical protein